MSVMSLNKKCAFIGADDSLDISEVKHFDGKRFATPEAHAKLDEAGITAQLLADPLGITRLYEFGFREIHLFGMDFSGGHAQDAREICFNNQIFRTDAERAGIANQILMACMDLMGKGCSVAVHGNGMLAAMAESMMRKGTERTLTAVYDFQVCPPTYEIFSFLTQAEKYRSEGGYTNMDVVFVPGPMHGFRWDGLPPIPEERDSMLHRICVAGTRLVRSVRNTVILKDRQHMQGEFFPPKWANDHPDFIYGPKFQHNGYRCLQATDIAVNEIDMRFGDAPYATITVRQAEYWPARNSNITAWNSAARWMRDHEIRPICIPDTHGKPLRDADAFEPAAWDIDLRMALYQGAQINLGVANGPMALPMLSKEPCPYLIFQKPDESSATPEEWIASQGIALGDQWTDGGTTVWGDDTQDSVIDALTSWLDSRNVKSTLKTLDKMVA